MIYGSRQNSFWNWGETMRGSVQNERSMSGQRFGRWLVQDSFMITPRNERKWLCRCDCGAERYVLERSLRYEGSVSCGCFRKEQAAQAVSPDLTGQTFGELTVVRKLENADRRNGVWWLCRCSCGEDYEVSGTLLKTGRRTRCPGKIHEKNYAFVDITGQKFEYLTALYPLKGQRNRNSLMWHCRCDCGKEIDVSYNSLVYSNQKSCGCQKKKHDQELRQFLTHMGGTSLEMIRSKKVPADNTTGYRGVYLIKGKYLAKIVFQKKAYYLGTYDAIEDAAAARKEAEETLFDGSAEYYEHWKQYADANPEWGAANPFQVVVSQDENKRLSAVFLPVDIPVLNVTK